MEIFGEWLLQQRNFRRLTREEFSNRVGCSISTLRKIEDGERRPSTQIAELIANVLDIPLAENVTFIKVARGELQTDRITHLSNLSQNPNIPFSRTVSHNNLPVIPTPLIGRIHELKDLSQLLGNPERNLLTLVGPGGIGKTRLAIETASSMQDIFKDGVYFVDLAPVSSLRFIIPLIANSIGFSFQGFNPVDTKTQLFNYLKDKTMLLLIDNVEHILNEPGIEMFSELLSNASKMKLLITSREPLNLQAEWVFEVNGLPTPEDPQTELIIRNTSIELFIQRARRALTRFNAETKDFPVIAHICRLVGGTPLAIELAAAWVRTLTCEEIASEIERSTDFLQTSARDQPSRHRSMRAVFDRSWKLLSEEEQKIVCRLSVFQGSFKREAAEKVAGASLQILSSLVFRSLLRHISPGRYELHTLLRNYILTKLDESSDELVNTKSIHCSYYLDFFGDREGDLRNEQQLIALAEIKAEFENIRVAWHHAVINDQMAKIRKPIMSFWFFDISARFHEAYSLFRLTIEEWESKNELGAKGDSVTIITLEHIRSNLAYICIKLGKFDEARRLLNQSLPILRSYGACTELLNALHHMGTLERLSGNLVLSQELFSEMLTGATRVGARWHLALAQGNIGVAAVALGEYQNAYNQLISANMIFREEGDRRILGISLQFLGMVLLNLGEYSQAQSCLYESLEVSRIIGDHWLRGLSLNQLGLVHMTKGENEEAAHLFCESLVQFREINEFSGTIHALKNLGFVYFSLRAYLEARSTFCELISITGVKQILPETLDAIIGMTHILMEEGELKEALVLVLLALAHPLLQHESKARAEKIKTKLKYILTPQQLEAAYILKNRISLQEVISKVVQTGQFHIQLDSPTV